MTISFGPDDSSPEFRPRRPPPDYRSWEVRSKLFMLVGLLAVALFAMRQARDPENYRWLIPEGEAPAEADPQMGNARDITSSVFGSERSKKSNADATDATSAPHSNHSGADATITGPLTAPSHSEWTREFWQNILTALDHDEQKMLFRLIGLHDRDWNPDSVDQLNCDLLIEKLDRLLAKKLADNLDRASQLSEARSAEKEIIADGMVSVRQQWDDQTKPAIQARINSEPLTAEYVQVLRQFAVDVQRDMLDLIQDATEISRPSDSLAWLLCWNELLKGHGPTEAIRVTPFELRTQPKRYRGQSVHFDGVLRGIDSVSVENRELNLSRYFVLWIQPKELDQTPYCVYVATLPPELSPSKAGFQKERRPVEVAGTFFKIRTYVDTEDKLSECPLILAKTITVSQLDAAVEAPAWNPPRWLIVLLIGTIPIVSAIIAFCVYRGSFGFQLPSSPGRRNALRESLDRLSQDAQIVGDKERIAELEKRHGKD